ncbi:MAG: DNA primase large subunit [Streblomastix strix]|uniref:DNA primase large subunit n=1 Tax=Streblomastix strix TaxID=222440 RepID=A0A5J4WYI2_9EUKA|nr:MAG: DNA primase large subunit [Streblomastix strix]
MEAIGNLRSTDISSSQGPELTCYDDEPEDILTLQQFYELGAARNELHKRFSEIRNATRSDYMDEYARIQVAPEFECLRTRKSDINSHWILRLACAANPEAARKFVSTELILFTLRYQASNDEQKRLFFQKYSIAFQQFESDDDFKEFIPRLKKQGLSDPTFSDKTELSNISKENYYLVNFSVCPFLVERRMVYLNGGIAFLHYKHLIYVLEPFFTKYQEMEIAKSKKLLETLSTTHSHLVTYLEAMVRRPVSNLGGSDIDGSALQTLTGENIDAFAQRSFPPCMLNMHNHLRKDHHLKYDARVQYGLFIKGCGMSLDESISLFRSEYTHSIPENKFDREYAYGIRYNYGLEGKRVNFTPKDCQFLIRHPGNTLEVNGCPFARLTQDELKPFLLDNCGLAVIGREDQDKQSSGDIEDVVGVQNGEKLDGIDSAGIIIEYIYNNTGAKHFHRACAEFFRIRHKGFNPFEQSPLTSPMAYFEKSRRWLNDQEIKRKETLIRNQREAGTSKGNLVRPLNQQQIQGAVQTPLRANLQTPLKVEIESLNNKNVEND